jgi:soluble lytic murein transglycosylase
MIAGRLLPVAQRVLPLARRALRSRSSYAGLALLGVVAITCSGQNRTVPPSSPAVQGPLDDSPGTLKRTTPYLTDVERLSLEEFTPVLALPGLQAVTQAVEADNPALAAQSLAALLEKSELLPEDTARFRFLLARLYERAGELAKAASTYDQARVPRLPLTDYAQLGAARVLVRMGKHGDALSRLSVAGPGSVLAEERRLLVAEAAYNAGDRDAAVENWRAHLADSVPPSQPSLPVALALAQALMEQASVGASATNESSERAKTIATSGTAVGLSADEADPRLVEALHWARRAAIQAFDNELLSERARVVEKRILEALPAQARAKWGRLSFEEELLRATALYDSKKYAEAEAATDALLFRLGKAPSDLATACEAVALRSRARAGQREWGNAADGLNEGLRFCKADREQLARALFLGARYAAADGRHALAIKLSETLEREVPGHRLGDDARLRAALSYYELGSEARFTELLTTLPEDYPEGDMVLDGVFSLAVRRIEKNDWSGAASVLERAALLVAKNDSARGTEFSGRERYFLARAFMETGERERGLSELETIIRELPLSYYMLQAYSRLVDIDPFRAKRARDAGILEAEKNPFSFARRPEFLEPGFVRAMELLRVGEFEFAGREVAALGLTKGNTAPAVLWGIALLYARAGSAKLSHAVARGLLVDWLQRWPAGDWTKAWELAFPRPYRNLVEQEAKKNGIPASLAYAIMREESAFDPEVVSPADAYGLMQLIVPTAREFARPVGLPFDAQSLKRPRVNIALGCRALGKLTTSFPKNPLLAIPAYNAGPGRPSRWLRERPRMDFDLWVELIPFNETRRYTKRVLASRAAYAFLYEHETADLAMALPAQMKL